MKLTDLTVKHLDPPEKGQRIVYDDALKGFGIRLSQGGSKTWVLVQGKARKMTTLGRYPDMGLGEARRQAVVAIATISPTEPTSASKTLQDAILGFLAACERTTKDVTVYQYRLYLKRVKLNKKLSDLTRKDVTEHLAFYDGKPTSQNYAYGTFRTFLNWCVEQEYITHSPITRMRAPNRLKSRERVLTDDEIKKIWEATDYKPYGHFVRCLLLSGQRKMEIYKNTTIADSLTFAETKNGKAHTIPLTPLLKAHLAPFNINHWSTQKDRLDRLSGVTDWRIHDLRRTWATLAIRCGIPSDHVEAVLNHSKKGVRGVYQRWHYAPEKLHALLTVEAFITTLIQPGHQPEPRVAPLRSYRENPQQAGTTSEDDHLDSAHHPTGEGREVPQTGTTHHEPCGVAGE